MKHCLEFCVGYLDSEGEKNRPDKNDAFRAFACIIDYMYFFDENTTVNGTVTIADAANYSMKLHGYISLEERRDFMQTWQVQTNTIILTNSRKTVRSFMAFIERF